MNIAIVGRHPNLEKGFNSVMSMLWVRGLSRFANKIILYLPISETHDPIELLLKQGFSDLDSLPRWGLNFEIKPIANADEIDNSIDVVIWQSYRPQEESLRKNIRKLGFFMVKNPPRLFSGDIDRDKKKADALCKEYDFIFASLQQDIIDISQIDCDHNKFAYLPRGFDVEALSPNKSDNPTIGFDKAVKGQEFGLKSIDHIVKAGEALLHQDAKVQFLSLRDSIQSLNSKRIPLLGYPDFYNQFINKLWVYMPIDFDYSVHAKGKVYANNQHRYIGLYENQIIEAQLSGALILSRRYDIPEELIMLPAESQVEDYSKDIDILEKLVAHLENFSERSMLTMEMSRSKHDYLSTTSKLYQKLKSTI
ncbi:hypothetical protein [Cobetia crustatorum]|uniref:Glycosyltransferase family 1 protein n=1 Tax=Cobetia crustatorum TaxID=553385 RepID=A0A558HQ87_9GAMM|nr:hypothetical protein [Cobetia crustatorum]TVU71285.1 hypothetical protein FQP86_07100 [Cobetia crustatorum]